MRAGSDPYLQRGAQVFHRVVYERALLPTLLCSLHRRTGQGGQLPPKRLQSRANVQHKSGEEWEIKKPKSPQFVGQTKAVGQYSLHSRAILAYYKKNSDKLWTPKMVHTIWRRGGGGGGVGSLKLICSTNNFFGTGWAQSEKVGQISFRPPNFFLPVRPWQSATLLSQYYH